MYNISLWNISNLTLNENFLDFLYDVYDEYNGDPSDLLKPNNLVALILGTVSIALNSFSLLAVSHRRSRLTTHTILIASLACSDILIGLSLTCYVINNTLNPVFGFGPEKSRFPSRCASLMIRAFNTTGLNLCLLNLTAMATDHYVAIIFPLHHSRIMAKKYGFIIVGVAWLIGFLLGFSDFYAESHNISRIQDIHHVNYCEAVWITRYQEEYCSFVLAFMTFAVMTYIYSRIYICIRKYSPPGLFTTEEVQQPRRVKCIFKVKIRHKRALVTTLIILGTFLICWLPLCTFQIALLIQARVKPEALIALTDILMNVDHHLYNLLLVNSILDPIIYAIRLREIRLGYKMVFMKCCTGVRFLRSEWSSRRVRKSTRSQFLRSDANCHLRPINQTDPS